MRRASALLVMTAALAISVSGASAHSPGGWIFYGAGTATVDGVLAPGEWANARRIEFGAAVPSVDGGGTVPATLIAMNDAGKLYVVLQVGRATYGANTSLGLYFDNDHDGVIEAGDEAFLADVDRFASPRFLDWHWGPCTPGGPGVACPVLDVDRGGTSEGGTAAGIALGAAVIEAWHPLDTADDSHDWSLGAGAVAGFGALITLWSDSPDCLSGPACYAHTVLPLGQPNHGTPTGYGHLVVSPDTVPPDTSISSGPAEGSLTSSLNVQFGLAGTDNLTPPEQLAFSCSLDGGAFGPCGALTGLADGPHRFAARATDELGQTDPSPAVRNWTVDTVAPETSIVGGPRGMARSRRATFSLSGTDNITLPSAIRFECSLDGGPVRSCGPDATFAGLRDGPHRLQASSRDVAGNVDGSPAVRQWSVDATPPSRPRVRVSVRGRRISVRLAATDRNGVARFRCALDRGRYRPCPRRFSRRVGQGRHTLRARAFDRAGNASAPGLARFRAK
jgi:hypothetical protein